MKLRMTNDELRWPTTRLPGPNSAFEIRRLPFTGAFTLIELILVLALLVIITSLAAPAMANFIRGRALDSEARRLSALMHAAQSRAPGVCAWP